MPAVAGTAHIPSLHQPVEVYRDRWGVPHIYAGNVHDLFLAQGYVHAQDRFAQMEFSRRFTAGRLSEVFGAPIVEADRFVRTLGWSRVVEQEVALLDEDTRQIVQAYADGVNAYISARSHLGLEFEVMNVMGIRYTPDPWSAADSLRWLKAMAMNMNGNLYAELRNAQLIQTMDIEAMRDIWPAFYETSPLVIPQEVSYNDLKLAAIKAGLDAVKGSAFSGVGIGSNSWVLAGGLTDTGKPYLANDPHLGIQMPSTWYEVGLHCNIVAPDCPYDVTGVSFAGVPGVIIGHNQRIAWGFTNLNADVQDLYIERVNPENANQYEVNGQWEDFIVVNETILVRGELPPPQPTEDNAPAADAIPAFSGEYDAETGFTRVTLPVRLTRHGPVIDDYEIQARRLDGSFGPTQVPAQHVTALRWTALEPAQSIHMIYRLNRAQNWEEFRQAMRYFDVPSQSVVYADVDGNIGFQAPGKIPIRAKGDGQFPVPGWNDEYEWQGYIPFEALPHSYNPPEGYIVAANNAIVGPDYPYFISMEWDPGTRAGRIVDMIEAYAGQPITLESIAHMQADVLNVTAQQMLPYLAALHFDDPDTQAALERLLAWDCQQRQDSGPAALYAVFWVEVVKMAFEGKFPSQQWPSQEAVVRLLDEPSSSWWDNASTPGIIEQRDDLLRQAFVAALADARALMGPDAQDWAWGRLQTATFSNGTFGFLPVIGQLFNRGPFPVSGWSNAVNAMGGGLGEKPNAADPATYAISFLPSMRTIVDLNDLSNARIVHTTGQSGHPYSPHYDDLIAHWQQNEYHPQLWVRADIEATAEKHLQLVP